MYYKDIMSAKDALEAIKRDLIDAYEANGGEITEETEALEAQREAITDLLEGEGIDTFGRWYKSVEDERAMYKAEKAAADRKIKATEKTLDYIKQVVGDVLRATGREKVKGAFYSFQQFVSKQTSYDAEAVDAEYLEKVIAAARAAGLPECIDVALKTTASRLQADEDNARFVSVTENPTSKFTKPRGGKDGE